MGHEREELQLELTAKGALADQLELRLHGYRRAGHGREQWQSELATKHALADWCVGERLLQHHCGMLKAQLTRADEKECERESCRQELNEMEYEWG